MTRALVFGGEISLAVLDTTALVNEFIVRHGLSPVAAAALGRTATACAYLCGWLKEETSVLTVSVKGDGAGGAISVSGDGALRLHGNIAVPGVSLPLRADGKLDVGACVGKHGTLTVIRDDGDGIPFVGTSELVSGEIAEDFSAYFLKSEQRPTALALGVRVDGAGTCVGAGGVFLQLLPGAGEGAVAYAEEKIGLFSSVSHMLETSSPRAIMKNCFGVTEYERRPIRFRCGCSKRKAAAAVLALGREEAFRLLEETGAVNVHCHDCNTDYPFLEEELTRLFSGRRK